MNNRWYAITATDADCRGTGGIYDVTDFVNLPLSGEESPAMVEQENLYPIELDGGKMRFSLWNHAERTWRFSYL